MTETTRTQWANEITTVGSLDRLVPEDHPDHDRIVFVSDSQDVSKLYLDLGYKQARRLKHYDSFFVVVGDGEYDAVWGMDGIVPGNHKPLTRIL